jgi:hypothetical protein
MENESSALWEFWSRLGGSSIRESNTTGSMPERTGVALAELPKVDLGRLARDHELEVIGAYGREVVLASKKFDTVNVSNPFAELGSTSLSPWTSFTRQEYNQDLYGLKGLEKYDRMRRSDGTVRGTLRLVKSPVLSARYFMEPGGDLQIDQTAAKFMSKAIGLTTNGIMSTPWMQTLYEATLMLDFGYYMFEKVFDQQVVDGTPRIVWKKFAPRHPMDVKQWHFDANGGPSSVEMYKPYSPNFAGGGSFDDSVTIPIEKMLVFTFDKEAGNIEGISVLRSAYKHWYYKDQLYKIDAIQKERHGIGIPVIALPPGYKQEDKDLAENLGRNIRTNERAHITLPPGWEIAMLKMEGHATWLVRNCLLPTIRLRMRSEMKWIFLHAIRQLHVRLLLLRIQIQTRRAHRPIKPLRALMRMFLGHLLRLE